MKRWAMRLFDGGAGSSGTLAEIPELELKTAEDVKKYIASLRTRVNELSTREKSGRVVTPDEWTGVDEGIKKLGAKLNDVEQIVKANVGRFNGFESPYGLVNREALTLDPPDDLGVRLDREYYNAVSLHPEELISRTLAGARQIPGMERQIARALESEKGRAVSDVVSEFQRLNDVVYVVDTILCGERNDTPYARQGNALDRMKTLKVWREYERASWEVQRVAGINESNATEGKNWVPFVLSAQMLDIVQMQLRVAALFPQLTMTSKTLDWPVLGGDVTAYKQGEATTDAASGITASAPVFNLPRWTAVKAACRVFCSTEATEDIIIPVVPFILGNIAKVLARGIEDCIVNGQDTALDGTNLDTLAAFNTSIRTLWHGLRYRALKPGTYTPRVSMAGAFDAKKILDVQLAMREYGAIPSDGAIITGYKGFKAMLADANVITMDKFGPRATILNGQIADLWGSPVILSEFVPITNASGIVDTTTANNTKGSMLYVYRPGWGLGQRRGITVRGSAERHIEADQLVYVGTWRGDYQPFYGAPTDTTGMTVGYLYNIT